MGSKSVLFAFVWILFIGFASTNAQAKILKRKHIPTYEEKKNLISDVQIKVIREEQLSTPGYDPAGILLPSSSQFAIFVNPLDGVTLDQIVNLGKQFWGFLQANKPVVNVATVSANALPEGVKSPYDLRMRWPKNATIAKVYRIGFTNYFGHEIGSFEFRVVYTYGGNIAGHGLYLSGVKIVPGNVNVGWGNKLGATVQVANIYASGTSNDPTAVIELEFDWNLSNVLKNLSGSRTLMLQGDGSFQDITDGN